ncbi:maleylpyruvate isomerase family mycothiol-dependent enzyme [Rhodococcus tibetensis]|uniref:Maleylpyruvate isomerase family mycothiol-dependent enzyme n=1 Tax=Rhodococcus tibetensis TaxID=2965064 RepID=A0ABT1Q9I0_9NOCA|nr:maleylpyruvate isomerase family mycothiol-dependent enzyme [Rhodococcus sp. FXJ9.536]MCQ4118924.1 maleylpyruvate isomerase family mycothiol-dependent enzyme [Rhodococcus sp. FXJ9.536]
MNTLGMLASERRELVNFLQTLTPEEWQAPSLCEKWRVRDVVAHLLYDAIPLCQYMFAAVRNGPGVDRLNNHLVDTERSTSPSTLLTRFASIENGTLSRLSPRTALADMLVHHQDIRRPLGRDRTIEPDRLRFVLNHPDPFAFTRRYTRGLRFEATDLTWSKGNGPEIRGTGEALALAATGRRVVLDELEGDGVAVLRNRLGSSWADA